MAKEKGELSDLLASRIFQRFSGKYAWVQPVQIIQAFDHLKETEDLRDDQAEATYNLTQSEKYNIAR